MHRRLYFLLAAVLALASLSMPIAEAGWGSCSAAVAATVQIQAPAFTGWQPCDDASHILGWYSDGVQTGLYNSKTHVWRDYDRAKDSWGPPRRAPWTKAECASSCECQECRDGCACPDKPCDFNDCTCGPKANKRLPKEIDASEEGALCPKPCSDGCTCCECEDGCRCGKGKPCGEGCPCLTKAIKPIESIANPTGAMDLPADVREWFRNPDGSCVQCSIAMCGVDQNVPAAATLLWDTEYGSKERGGSYPSRVAAYCKRRGIMAYNVTGSNTWDWMKWAALTGRGAAIGAGGSHFQTLAGYDPSKGLWYVINNNSPQKVDVYNDDQFRRLHLASGQWVVILDYPAHPERPEYIEWWKGSPRAAASNGANLLDAGAEVRRGFGQGVIAPPEVERDEVLRRGDMVEHLGGIRDDGLEAFAEAMAPPRDDSDKWFISLVTMKGCAPCDKLKAAWSTSPELRAFAKPDNPKESWAHFTVYDKDDKSQQFRFPGVVFRGFPTLIVQPPRTGSFGAPKTVVFQATGYDGNPRALAQSISTTLRKYVATLPKREGAQQREVRPPWQPPPKVPPAPMPDVAPNLPSVDVPPPDALKPAPASSFPWLILGGVVVIGGGVLAAIILMCLVAFFLVKK